MDRTDLGEGAWLALAEGFVPEHEAAMHRLCATLPLAVETILLFGRPVETPRLASWHGDPEARYAYSGRTFEPRAWTPELLAIKARVDAAASASFNSVLVNHYRDGRDSMGEHADDEPELGPAPGNVLIASVSLGARRRFVLRHKRRKTTHELLLGEGSLLLMGGATQTHFRHRVPRTTLPVGPRMNLTFRIIVGRARPSD